MGGACQVGWEHSVAQVRDMPVASRISVQWRWTSEGAAPSKAAPTAIPAPTAAPRGEPAAPTE